MYLRQTELDRATQLLNLHSKFQWLLLNVKEQNRSQYFKWWKMEWQNYTNLTSVRWNLFQAQSPELLF